MEIMQWHEPPANIGEDWRYDFEDIVRDWIEICSVNYLVFLEAELHQVESLGLGWTTAIDFVWMLMNRGIKGLRQYIDYNAGGVR